MVLRVISIPNLNVLCEIKVYKSAVLPRESLIRNLMKIEGIQKEFQGEYREGTREEKPKTKHKKAHF